VRALLSSRRRSRRCWLLSGRRGSHRRRGLLSGRRRSHWRRDLLSGRRRSRWRRDWRGRSRQGVDRRRSVQEHSELSAKVGVRLGSAGFPKHDAAEDARILAVHIVGDRLQSSRADVASASRVRARRSADQDLDVLVERLSRGPRGPGGKVELARILVEAAVVVVELDEDVVEPSVGKGESGRGA